jgi:hypothetical protein
VRRLGASLFPFHFPVSLLINLPSLFSRRNDRKATVEKTTSDRISKRNSNLAARATAKKDKKLGIKKKTGDKAKKTSSSSSAKTKTKGRPGFEGGGRKKK